MKSLLWGSLLVLAGMILPVFSFAGDLQWVGTTAAAAGAGVSGSLAEADCTIGNQNSPSQLEVDAVQSDMEFAYLIDPADFNCCDEGFQPESITLHLNFGPEDLLYLPVQVAVLAAVGEPGAWRPSEEICASPPGWFLNADVPGLYTITIPPYPTGPGDLVCPCLDSMTPYFIVGRLVGTITPGGEPDAVTDGVPAAGRSFVRQGGGPWQEAVADLGWAGELVQRAAVVCCDDPVGLERATWGHMKSLYR